MPIFLYPCVCQITDKDLALAFSEVYQLKDNIQDGSTPVLGQALLELEKMGINRNMSNLCELDSGVVSRIFMKASLGEYISRLQDLNDWNIVVANAETGQLVRQRSFSSCSA